MYHNIVITGGISLLAPNNLFGKHLRDNAILDFNRTNPVLPVGKTIDETLKVLMTKLRGILPQAKQNPLTVSAEYSLLNAIKVKSLLGDSPRVSLLHSVTFGGSLSASCLKEILGNDFNAEVTLVPIEDLDISQPSRLNRAISRFMLKIGDNLKAYPDKNSTCLAPLGGYKVMTSYGYIAGSFYGFPAAYVHEDIQALHILPAIPIEIKSGFVDANAELIRRLLVENVVEYKTLNHIQKQKVEENPYLFELAENMITLNSFGHFIFMQPQYAHLFGTKIYLSPEAKSDAEQFRSAKDFIGQQLSMLINKLKSDPEGYWGELHHEFSWVNLKNKTPKYFLYKGSSNGQLVFRATWIYDNKSDALQINRIWCDHKVYEKEVNTGIGFFNKQDKWFDMTKEYLTK